ncbi:major royal jelly protein-domain-containing protein [Clohesyomyces aquaticus]|uniref:Major royal jelly protein-domain-containing protein n=1 Tax=Clohesyomyces aquaticus TaxID=1231657 RepID=A0A1Y2A4G1_9PLEO|nr:major royal jelly protein-domain-containing protein [Clohesyomyces aquaticus]
MRYSSRLCVGFLFIANLVVDASCPTCANPSRSQTNSINTFDIFPPDSPTDYGVIGPPLQAVHSSSSPPTGLAIDPNQTIYLSYPRNAGPTPNNVVICPSSSAEEPWPNASIQNCTSTQNASTCFINVQNIVLDSLHQLWVVDSGIPAGQTRAVRYGAKIMSFDWQTRALKRTYIIPETLYYDNMNTNDVRINNTLGTAGFAFITDASASGSLLTLDLNTGHVLRRLYNTSVVRADEKYVGMYNGNPIYSWKGTKKSHSTTGADGIALQSGNMYWGVLASRRWYYIPQTLLTNASATEEEVLAGVVFPEQIGTEQAGLTADDKGRVYICASEHNAIFYVDTQQKYVTEEVNGTPAGGTGLVKPENYVVKTLVRNALIQHADSAAIWDGWLYFCTNQLELGPGRQYGNVDNRKGPFVSYRVWIGAGPAL